MNKPIVIETLPHGLSTKSFVESLLNWVGDNPGIDMNIYLEHRDNWGIHYRITMCATKESKVFDLYRYLSNYGIEIPCNLYGWVLYVKYEPFVYHEDDPIDEDVLK